MSKTSASRLRGHRGLVIAATICVLSAAIGLLAAGRGWVGFTVAEPPLPRLHKTASGHSVAAAVTPLALVVLAGVVAFPATRKVGRRLAGLLVGLAGIGLVIEASDVLVSPTGAVAAEAARLAGRTQVRPTAVAVGIWPWVVIVAGLLAVVAGLVTVAFSSDWPAMGRRYESGGRPASRTAGRTPREVPMWDRFDEGDDPTV